MVGKNFMILVLGGGSVGLKVSAPLTDDDGKVCVEEHFTKKILL